MLSTPTVIFRRPSIQSPQLSNIDNTKVPLTSYMGLTESVMSEHLDIVSDGDEEMMVRFVEAQTPHKFDPQAHRYVEENTLNDSNQRSSRRSSEHENASVNEVSNYASSKRALDIDYNGHMEDESFSGVDDCILPGIKVGDERENGDNQGAAHNVGSSTADNATTVHQSIENGDKQNSNRTLFAVEHDEPFSKHSGFIVDVAAQAGPTSAEGRLIDGAIDERYVESGSGDCSFDCSPQSYSDNNRTDVVVSKPREALSFGQDLNIGISGAPTDDGRERTNTKCKEYKKMTGMSREQAILSGVGRDKAEESQPVLRHEDLSSSRQIRGMHQNNSILSSKKPEPTNDDQLRPCYLSAGTTAIGAAAINTHHVAEVVSRPGIQSTNKHTLPLGESDHRLQHQLTYPSERIVKHDSVGNNLFVPESNIRPLPKIIRRSSGVGNASTSAFGVNDNGPVENQKLEVETFVAIEPNSEMCHSSRLSRNAVKDKAGQSKEALQAKEGNGFIEDVNATTESSFQRDSNTEIHPQPDFRVNRLFGVEVRTPGINVLAEKRNNAFDFSSLQKPCNKRHGQHHSLSRKVSFSNRKCSPDNVVSLGRTHNSHGSLSASRGQESRQQRNKAVVKVDRRVPSPQLSRSNPHVHSIPRTNSGRRPSSEAKGRDVKVKVEQSHSGNMRLLSGKRSKKIHIVDDLFDDSDSCFGCEIIAYTKAPKNNSILLKKHSKISTTTPDCITSDPGMISKMSKHRTDQRKRKVSKGEIPTKAPPPKIRNHGAENINDCISIMNKTCIARTRSIKVNLPESEFDYIGGVDNFQEDDAFDSPSKIVSTNNFFDIYFGQESDEFASHSSAQSHLLHQCNSDQFSNFHDYYFGQELYLEAQGDATKNERNASQTSHSKPQLRRFTLLFAFTLLASILPQSLPPYPLLLPSRQFYHPVFSVFEYDHNASDVNATTNHTHEEKSWWAKLYSY